ncbi:MAG: ATP-binding cassette domain-containing protein [Opitutales bacterium]|nr:ATP-binding cassette domain-containing protein [Opitutales bacterium]
MITVRNLSISFGGAPLLDQVQFTIEKGEHIALIGRNGEGKSTLMKILAGQISADTVEVEKPPNYRIAYLQQDVPETLEGTVREVISSGLGEISKLEQAYHDASIHLDDPEQNQESILELMGKLQHDLEALDAWDFTRKLDDLLSQLNLDGDLLFNELSGGMKRRAVLGRELITEPNLLLLDEPTNHLDLPSIQWMESFLPQCEASLLFVTHDREFLQNLSTSIFELDRGKLTRFDISYQKFLERKAEALDSEAHQRAVSDKKLAQEETWIRQGIKARRTRNEGRVRALKKLREERAQRRELKEGPSFSIQSAGLSGRKVIEIENLNYSWGLQPIVSDFTTTIWRGDKIGIIGANGSGKTTLLQLLLKQLDPNQGTVTHGTQLDVVYFDQHRAQLDPNLTLKEAVAGDEEYITVQGQKRHIYSYLSDFLFPSDRARGKVSALSGGEKNRLLLAKIFAKTANLLVLDEPTNDLDLETLELLEELLLEYPATLILVSHDRRFLDRVVTQTLAIEKNGKIVETVGGYQEYERDLNLRKQTSHPTIAKKTSKNSRKSKPEKPRYRTNREQRELDEIPDTISALEEEHEQIISKLSLPETATDPEKVNLLQSRLEEIDAQNLSLMERWEELENIPQKP